MIPVTTSIVPRAIPVYHTWVMRDIAIEGAACHFSIGSYLAICKTINVYSAILKSQIRRS